MAQPNYEYGAGMPLSGAPPILELKRGWGPRIALVLLVVPIALGSFVLAALMAFEPNPSFVAIGCFALFGMLMVALVVWRGLVEMNRSGAVYEQGLSLTTLSGTTTIRWEQVEEIWFAAQRVQMGGLLGMAISAGIDKLRKDKSIEERGVTITLRLVGGGQNVKLSNYDKGVFKAWQEAMRRVNPRLIADVVRRARGGERVTFGKNAVTISATGLSFGKKAEFPWQQIESMSIKNGQLQAKVTGKWFSSGAMIARIPNLFVLTAAVMQLSGGTMEMNVQPDISLAQRIYA